MPKRGIPAWMLTTAEPAPKRPKPNPVREIPDDMDTEFREDSGRNDVTLTAYPMGVDWVAICEGPPSPRSEDEEDRLAHPLSKERRQMHPALTPPNGFLQQVFIGPQPQEITWNETYRLTGSLPTLAEYAKWFKQEFGPATQYYPGFMLRRYEYLKYSKTDMDSMVTAHENYNGSKMATAPCRSVTTPLCLECRMMGVSFAADPSDITNFGKPYGPVNEAVTQHNLKQAVIKLNDWLCNQMVLISVTYDVRTESHQVLKFSIRRGQKLKKLMEAWTKITQPKGQVKWFWCDQEVVPDKSCWDLGIHVQSDASFIIID